MLLLECNYLVKQNIHKLIWVCLTNYSVEPTHREVPECTLLKYRTHLMSLRTTLSVANKNCRNNTEFVNSAWKLT
jgi:hypothetical protein